MTVVQLDGDKGGDEPLSRTAQMNRVGRYELGESRRRCRKVSLFHTFILCHVERQWGWQRRWR